jgi:uncharacterized SAM-binding protein YcdF (DUF218 family)
MKVLTRKRLLVFLAVVVLLLVFAANAGNMLVVDAPQKSDVIVVLAGETSSRPALALHLLDAGYARQVVIDVPAANRIYQWTQVELAEKYAQQLPQAAAVRICPSQGLSTREESHDVEKCLAQIPGASVLLVTSDFHTRRALSIFRRELPGRSFSVAASHDARHFGTRWWTHREWAKTCLDEWMRLIWWNAVERWR